MQYVSLGGNCAVAFQLDKFNKSHKRYPFDWCNMTLHQLIDVLNNNFHNFEDINVVKKSLNHVCFKTNDDYSLILKNKYNIKFAHELLNDDNIIEFKQKIKRRIERFNNLKCPIFIRLELFNKSKEYLEKNYEKLLKVLKSRFDNFYMIIISNKEIEIIDKHVIFHKFENYDNDWKYDNLDWKMILNI